MTLSTCTSRAAQTFLLNNGVTWWRTPAESPNCNLIENLWHELKEFIRRESKPTTKQELIDGIQAFWDTVDVNKCVTYIQHLRKVHVLHVTKVIEVEGAATAILSSGAKLAWVGTVEVGTAGARTVEVETAGAGTVEVRTAGGQDSRGWDSRGQDSRGWDSRGQDCRGWDSRGQDSRGWDSRARTVEFRIAGSRTVEVGTAGARTVEFRTAGSTTVEVETAGFTIQLVLSARVEGLVLSAVVGTELVWLAGVWAVMCRIVPTCNV